MDCIELIDIDLEFLPEHGVLLFQYSVLMFQHSVLLISHECLAPRLRIVIGKVLMLIIDLDLEDKLVEVLQMLIEKVTLNLRLLVEFDVVV